MTSVLQGVSHKLLVYQESKRLQWDYSSVLHQVASLDPYHSPRTMEKTQYWNGHLNCMQVQLVPFTTTFHNVISKLILQRPVQSLNHAIRLGMVWWSVGLINTKKATEMLDQIWLKLLTLISVDRLWHWYIFWGIWYTPQKYTLPQ